MKLTGLGTLVFAAVAAVVPCAAQSGTVTFYSIGMSAGQAIRDELLPVGTVPFTGWLYDGAQRMAHVQSGRFMTFRLPAGEHAFTVPWHSKGPGKTTLQLNVENGGHYCVRLYATYKSGSILLPLAYRDSQITQVPCPQAQKEAGNLKPIDWQRVDYAMQRDLENETSFPTVP